MANDADHWRVKAKCYGDMVHGITPALAAAGFPVEEFTKDGNVGAISRAVVKMGESLRDVTMQRDALLAAANAVLAVGCNWRDKGLPDAIAVLEDVVKGVEDGNQ